MKQGREQEHVRTEEEALIVDHFEYNAHFATGHISRQSHETAGAPTPL